MTRLISERLTIRTPETDSIGDIFRIMSSADLAERTGFKQMNDPSEAEGKIHQAIRSGDIFVISVIGRDNHIIGVIEVTPHYEDTPKGTTTNYDIGYFLEEEARGHGYMTETVNRLKKYLFEERNANYLTIFLEPDNPQSRNVALKCGFSFRYRKKDAAQSYRGREMDLEYYIAENESNKENKGNTIIMENYLNKQKWVNEGGIMFPIPGSATLMTSPGNGIFRIYEDKRFGRIGLEMIDEAFVFNFKIYDLDCDEIIDRIIGTWESKVFSETHKNLGIIFNGLKGTGKTIAAKLLSNRTGLPVIVISKPLEGMLEFIQSLNFEAVILIDEAEKTFEEEQAMLLKMIDGVYNCSRKLYILTTNKLNLDENLIGRPGRIRYVKQFGNLSKTAVSDIIDDNLIDISLKEGIMKLVDRLEISTIDILKAIIEECNITGSVPDSSIFNIPMAKYRVRILSFDGLDEERIEEMKQFITSHKPLAEDIETWMREKSDDASPRGKTWKQVIETDFDCRVKVKLIYSASPSLHSGQKLREFRTLSSPDANGFFEGEENWSDDRCLYCYLYCCEIPSLYKTSAECDAPFPDGDDL